jgi:dCTP deaminase
MSFLTDRELLDALQRGQIDVLTPIPFELQPASIDLHLNTRFGRLMPGVIDRYHPTEPTGPRVVWEEVPADGEGIALKPLHFLLASTRELVEIESGYLLGILCGKSTLARDGLHVEAAGLVDPGWRGRLTLELFNAGPATIILRPGQPICQMYVLTSDLAVSRKYGNPELSSHYQDAPTTQAGFDPATPDDPRRSPLRLRSTRRQTPASPS